MPQMPSLKGYPLIGCLPDFRKDRLALLLRAYREQGELVEVPMLGGPLIVVTGPEVAREVLVKKASKFRKSVALARYSRPMLGNGLLTAEGDVHRQQRRRLQPGLKHRKLSHYVDTMVRHSEDFLKRLEGKSELDLHTEMTQLTLGIAAETMFGAAPTQHAAAVSDAIAATTRYIAVEVTRPVHFPINWPTPRNIALRRAVGTLDRIVRNMIQERRENPSDRPDILNMLLSAQDEEDGSKMTDEQVRDEVMTLFVAGHDTLANSLTFSLALLARHPEVADRLARESAEVLEGRAPTYEDLEKLPYALQVFKEALRLFPPAYLAGRETLEAVELGGYEIPPKTTVFVSIYGMHRRPDLFPDPERFDPDRFLPEAEKARPRGAYIPFSDGPRICIGNHFALLEGQIVLSYVGQHLAFTEIPDEPIEAIPTITMRAKGKPRLRVTRRELSPDRESDSASSAA